MSTKKYNVNNKIHNNILLRNNEQKKVIAFPRGILMIWNYPDKIPSGWSICDGTNGTPDLRGRFIRMTNDKSTANINSYSMGDIGGTENIKWDKKYLPNHNHNATYNLNCMNITNSVDSDILSFDANGGIANANRNVTYNDKGNSKYGDITINNMPPYVALTCIMKL
jgi:microcystin-dependent protein